MCDENGKQMGWVPDERRWVPLSELALMYSRPVAHTRCTDCLKFRLYREGFVANAKKIEISHKCDRCNRLLTFNTVTREVDDEELPGEKASMASKEKPPSKEASVETTGKLPSMDASVTIKEKRRAKKLP